MSSDLLVFESDSVNVPVKLTLRAGNVAGSKTTPASKAAQRFLLRLYTQQGTVRGLPSMGTNFPRLIERGELRTVALAEQAFIAAVNTILNQEQEDPPDDPGETIERVDLRSVSVQNGTVTYRFTLTLQSGISAHASIS